MLRVVTPRAQDLETLFAVFVTEMATAPDGAAQPSAAAARIAKKLARRLGSAEAGNRPASAQLGGHPPDKAEC